jgi:uncharacterized protein YdeI (YjbR/CyaY-like superfamily)
MPVFGPLRFSKLVSQSKQKKGRQMVAFLFDQFFKFVYPIRQIKMMNPKVDAFFSTVSNWKEELTLLRRILLDCGLREELKWSSPCYTFQNANVALLHGFKAYCGIGFFKGALLQDSEGILSKPGENTQSSRIMKFTQIREITALEAILKAYMDETVEEDVVEEVSEQIIEEPIKQVVQPVANGLESPKNGLTFNDIDYVRDENNNELNIRAPKTIERLEEISEMRNIQRKQEADEEDANEKLNISGETVELSGLDIHEFEDPTMKLLPDLLIDDIEILELLKENPDLEKYGLKTNMGYATEIHRNAIKLYGLTEYHRKSFKLKN